jgi:hypothetical protein
MASRRDRSTEVIFQRLASFGIEAEHLSRNDITPLRYAWLDLFMPAHMALKAKENRLHHDWHLFSHEKIQYLEGDEARQRFNRYCNATQIIWTSDARIGGFRVHWSDKVAPAAEVERWESLDYRWQDVIATDESYHWAFAVTHERHSMGLGPYFADRPNR